MDCQDSVLVSRRDLISDGTDSSAKIKFTEGIYESLYLLIIDNFQMQPNFYQNCVYYLQSSSQSPFSLVSVSNQPAAFPFNPYFELTQSQLQPHSQPKTQSFSAFKPVKTPFESQPELSTKSSQLSISQISKLSQITGVSNSLGLNDSQSVSQANTVDNGIFSSTLILPIPIRSYPNFLDVKKDQQTGPQSVSRDSKADTKSRSLIHNPQAYYASLEENSVKKQQSPLQTTDDLIWKKLMKQQRGQINKRRRNYRNKKVANPLTNEQKAQEDSSTRTKHTQRTQRISKANLSQNRKILITNQSQI